MSSYFRTFVETTSWQAEWNSIIWYSARRNSILYISNVVQLIVYCRFPDEETKSITCHCRALFVLCKSWSLRNCSSHLR